MNPEYKKKYLEYKARYLALTGGQGIVVDKRIVSIVVTHNNRLKCFLRAFFQTQYNQMVRSVQKSLRSKIKDIQFQNGCILKLVMDGAELQLSMLYSGNIANTKKMFYFGEAATNAVIQHDKQYFIDFITASHKTSPNDSESININFPELNLNHTIYLITHGESAHNVGPIGLKRDRTLTKTGIEQIISTAAILYKIIEPNLINIDQMYYFSSQLKRTRQTIGIIHKTLNKYPGGMLSSYLPKSIIVLPCANELSYTGTQCDAKNVGIRPAVQNMRQCTQMCPNPCSIATSSLCCCVDGILKVDWSHYLKFHDDKQSCKDTNILTQLDIIISKIASGPNPIEKNELF